MNNTLKDRLVELNNAEQVQPEEKKEEFDYDLDRLPKNSVGHKLTRKQRDYCRYRVATGNIKRSAKLAGYTDGYGYQAEYQPNIQEFIKELKDYKLANSGYSKEKLMDVLGTIAVHDVTDYVDVEEQEFKSAKGTSYTKNVLTIKPLSQLKTKDATDEVGDVMYDRHGNPIEEESLKTLAIKGFKTDDRGNVTPEFYDRMTAIDKLAKIYDLYSPSKVEFNDVTVELDKRKEELKNKIGKLKKSIASDKIAAELEQEKEESDAETEGE